MFTVAPGAVITVINTVTLAPKAFEIERVSPASAPIHPKSIPV
jgi:hypothetical protein